MKVLLERADIVPRLASVFRDFGYEGTTLARIGERTGITKGSLYHFFPGGKHEMAMAVLAEIDAWFESNVFRSLREDEAEAAIATMWSTIDRYYRSGQNTCVFAIFGIVSSRDQFAVAITSYFRRWIDALAIAIERTGLTKPAARRSAETIVSEIQGALLLAHALNEPTMFTRTLARLRAAY
ncbi:TetR/AcrR family transcriptional regulator [Rhizobium sp. WYJ-E13]|uniref:TetR/AcrR family transcriptional regulator n=1 Tax=Rhizobium sp. WYJ-E13 TaxID=2849093 RepID=UPI001C1EFD4A|nr:TetR/AcrR family transcriptional regulator [Rhizobium sp. WYJ-E13]QWW72612.1 TetR/AcrR family transcriptional regulator [Rhizobium sp. WYJ-E13]